MIVSTLGGRRFLLTLGCGVMTTLLCWFAKITGEVYATVIIATVGGYITGNTWQKIKGGAGDAGAG
jgi:hypothetical protein